MRWRCAAEFTGSQATVDTGCARCGGHTPVVSGCGVPLRLGRCAFAAPWRGSALEAVFKLEALAARFDATPHRYGTARGSAVHNNVQNPVSIPV